MPTPRQRRVRGQQAASRGDHPIAGSPLAEAFQSDAPISGFSIIPLRLFLGVTFVYAALQKIMDPGFFHAGAPTYIGAQILAFSRGSPLQGLLHHLMEFALAVGIVTVLTEGCIGLLVLLGLFTRPAALVGMVLSMGFFLSASWNTYPYFFGSDIVFVVCWLTLAITGPGVFALDTIVAAPLSTAMRHRLRGRSSSTFVSVLTGWYTSHDQLDKSSAYAVVDGELGSSKRPLHRRITRGEAVVGALATLGLVALGLHPRRANVAGSTGRLASSGSPKSGPTGGSPTPIPGGTSAIPPGARKIGNVSQLPVNSAGTVSDPKTGDPAVIVHTSGSNFYAFDAVCTHAGCTVQYDSQQKMLVCPCHGGTFDPAHGAQVVAGPPPAPLTPIKMTIDSHGEIYIV